MCPCAAAGPAGPPRVFRSSQATWGGFRFHPPQFPSLVADPTPFGHRLPSQVLGTRNSSTARLLTPRMFVHHECPRFARAPNVYEPCVLSCSLRVRVLRVLPEGPGRG